MAALPGSAARAWDFSYGYNNATATNADTYTVGQQNVRKFIEWQSPPVTYWGAVASGVPGALTMRFDFAGPTTEVFVKAVLVSANHGYYYGTSSLWASKDGASWQLLLDHPTASGEAAGITYAQSVPEALLGSRSFWVQLRLTQWNSPPGVSDAQFGRYDPASSDNVFQINARLGKAGDAVASPSSPVVGGSTFGARWVLVCALLALMVALLAGLCAITALVFALLGRSGREAANAQAVQQRLTMIDHRLNQLEQRPDHKP